MTQDEALTILKTGASVFLTGEPGSGKTHTVNRYVDYLLSCGVEPAITASTGIAATHIGGQTLHSWCGIGIRTELTPYDLDTIAGNRKVTARVGTARVLVIDEVSMLSGETLMMADAVCREVRRSSEPFGGLQVILVGDFFQLPPVSKPLRFSEKDMGEEDVPAFDFNSNREVIPNNLGSSPFAFASPAWRKMDPLVCYLSEQHRQEDTAFLEFLTAVRRGEVGERHKTLLRTRYKKSAEPGVTQLYSHNANVDHINTAQLAKLSGQPKVFVMTGRGPDPLVVALKRGCLSPEVLSLKVGARVMFTKNDMVGRFMNGTTGTVSEFKKDTGTPVVKTDSGRMIVAEPLSWMMQDGGKILAQVEQVPLRLAWAITVHKSQGMSLDRAHMDLGSAFEYGQGYVALSRVRTLQGLSLSGLNTRALEVHPKVFAEDRRFHTSSDMARKKFRELSEGDISELHANFLRAIGGKPGAGRAVHTKKEKIDTLAVTKTLILKKLSLAEVAKERGQTLGTILSHLEKLVASKAIQVRKDLMHLSPDPDRIAHIERSVKKLISKTPSADKEALYDTSGSFKLSPIRAVLGDSYSFEELRLARLFLPAPLGHFE